MYEEIEIEKQDFAGGWIAVTWPRPNASRRVQPGHQNIGVDVIDNGVALCRHSRPATKVDDTE